MLLSENNDLGRRPSSSANEPHCSGESRDLGVSTVASQRSRVSDKKKQIYLVAMFSRLHSWRHRSEIDIFLQTASTNLHELSKLIFVAQNLNSNWHPFLTYPLYVPQYQYIMWLSVLELTTTTTLGLLRAYWAGTWFPISIALSLTPANAASSLARG